MQMFPKKYFQCLPVTFFLLNQVESEEMQRNHTNKQTNNNKIFPVPCFL